MSVPKCGAKTRTGSQCGREAGWGTDHVGFGHCKHHGGASPAGQQYAGGLMAQAEMQVMGVQLDVDPLDALLWCVRVAAGEVAYASNRILELTPDQAVGHLETTKRRPLSLGKEGEDPDVQVTERTETPPQLHVWIRVRHDALDRLARYSKMALDAGVAERQVALAERYGEMIATLLGGVLADLDLSPAQQEIAPAIVRRHMAVLEAGPAVPVAA